MHINSSCNIYIYNMKICFNTQRGSLFKIYTADHSYWCLTIKRFEKKHWRMWKPELRFPLFLWTGSWCAVYLLFLNSLLDSHLWTYFSLLISPSLPNWVCNKRQPGLLRPHIFWKPSMQSSQRVPKFEVMVSSTAKIDAFMQLHVSQIHWLEQ